MLSNNYVKVFENRKNGDFPNEYVALFSVKADGNIIHDNSFWCRFIVFCDTQYTNSAREYFLGVSTEGVKPVISFRDLKSYTSTEIRVVIVREDNDYVVYASGLNKSQIITYQIESALDPLMVNHIFANKKKTKSEIENTADKFTITPETSTVTMLDSTIRQDFDSRQQDIFIKDGYVNINISFYTQNNTTISRGFEICEFHFAPVHKSVFVSVQYFSIDSDTNVSGVVPALITTNNRLKIMGTIPPYVFIGLNARFKVDNIILD